MYNYIRNSDWISWILFAQHESKNTFEIQRSLKKYTLLIKIIIKMSIQKKINAFRWIKAHKKHIVYVAYIEFLFGCYHTYHTLGIW